MPHKSRRRLKLDCLDRNDEKERMKLARFQCKWIATELLGTQAFLSIRKEVEDNKTNNSIHLSFCQTHMI
jgi:hypothetical protein